MSKYLVTFALPYANGPLHLGHLVEMVDADIWVRARRHWGEEVYFVSGSDSHGTPIMLKAAQRQLQPQELVSLYHSAQKEVLDLYGIDVDHFSRTDSETHRPWVEKIYTHLKKQDLLSVTEREQAYDEKEKMFLPDRYVKGTCPHCQSIDQNGDNCEVCGATYSPRDLSNPRSVISGAPVVFKKAPTLEVKLEKRRGFLQEKVTKYACGAVVSKFQEWLCQPLKPWSISRPAPYHGLAVPDRPGEHFYVWFDAPIGYLSFFDELFSKKKITGVQERLQQDTDWKLVHFIGKDIAYFHGLFWPVLLDSAQLECPSNLFVHGFLTINGLKMSKSRGTFIQAQEFSSYCDPELLRYYLASKLNGQIDDINFDVSHFVEKINADLVGKFINIISRLSKLLFQYAGGSFHCNAQTVLTDKVLAQNNQIDKLYRSRSYLQVCQISMALCDEINEAISKLQPWKTLKQPESFDQAHQQVTDMLCAYKQICYYLSPVMPKLCQKILHYYNDTDGLTEAYKPIVTRLTLEQFKELISVDTPSQTQTVATIDEGSTISIDEFLKVDLRVAKVLDAQPVEGADKLIQAKLDIGTKIINVFAGIKRYYECQNLIGKKVIACVNLKPRKMKFGLSEGMILAASSETFLSVVSLDIPEDIKPGSKVS